MQIQKGSMNYLKIKIRHTSKRLSSLDQVGFSPGDAGIGQHRHDNK